MFNEVRCSIRRCVYRLKAHPLYYYCILGYALVLLSICHHLHLHLDSMKDIPDRVLFFQLLEILVPFFSTVLILLLKDEEYDLEWGELYYTFGSKKYFDYFFFNLLYNAIIFLIFCYATTIYSDIWNIYFQVVCLEIYFQIIGCIVIKVTKSQFTAFAVLIIYICISIYLLENPFLFFLNGYILNKEMSFCMFIKDQGWKFIFVTFINILMNSKYLEVARGKIINCRG